MDAFERAAEQERIERRRRRRRRAYAGFQIHLRTYLAVQVFLVAIWALIGVSSGEWDPWIIYPALGWGIGVAAHYSAVRPRQAASGESSSE